MMASMASGVVDCCLIPENKFDLDKLNAHIEAVIGRKGHCVICVAEGAGQVRLLRVMHSIFHDSVCALPLQKEDLSH